MNTTFAGGVHPAESKALTQGLAVKEVEAPNVLVVPMRQHTGVPATPVIKQGDKVLKGSVLGQPAGFISAAVHSPVSGEVLEVQMRQLPVGSRGLCVVIKNDHQETWAPGCNVPFDASRLDAKAIRERIRASGIVGMGGATFPTDVKLAPPENKPIEILIVNGAECEPYLTADHRLMLEDPDAIIRGAQMARRAVGARTILFAVEDNKRDAYDALKKSASVLADARAEILPTRYPQGAEKQLIKALAGREVPSGGLPLDVGIVVQNVATCAAIYYALSFNRPLIDRIVTVTGPCAASPGNFRVRIGTPYADLLKVAGLSRPPKRVVMGGPLMGIAQPSLDIPVTKGTSGLLLLDEIPADHWLPCIRCGKCVRACPVSIMPNELGVLLEFGQLDQASSLNLLDCIECGCCTYVCPSMRPIVNWVKAGKAALAERRARQQRKAAK